MLPVIVSSSGLDPRYRAQGLRVVASSGGFDPLHRGHIRMFEEAKRLGDVHIVILNNDNWLLQKKESLFMAHEDRVEVLRALRSVDGVMPSLHQENPQDMSVVRELSMLRPHIFVNGGDRVTTNTPEFDVCQKLGIRMEFNVGFGGKVQSSSWLLDKYTKNHVS